MQNNSLEVHNLSTVDAKNGAESTAMVPAASTSKKHTVSLPGHHADVRALALSSDDQMILSIAGLEAKIWNVLTCQVRRRKIHKNDQ